ncbi:MAG: twin-arginine translocase subunit TatC [Firmicutes bacterium]|nr:twin-arginine translocase subunit TatC [Bacillota bacterium]
MTTNERANSEELNTAQDVTVDSASGSLEEDNELEQNTREEEKAKVMDLVGHLTELRTRLIISLLSFAAGSIVGWFYSTLFLRYISGQVGAFVFVAPAEAFISLLKIAMSIGLVLSSPIILSQLWLFIMPGLLPREIFFFKRYVPFVIALFIVGLVFAHFAVYPIALRFFLGFGTEKLQARLAIGRFLSFFLTMHLPFGVMFELPVVILALVRAGLIRVEFLLKQRKMAYLGAFVLGAMLTPPDPVSQVLMGGPMILLFELSLFLARRVNPVGDEEVRATVSGGDHE